MNIKKEINENFKKCNVITYYGDQIIDLDDKGVYLMSGFKIPYDLINRCGLDYSKHRTSDQASHIIRTLLDEQPVYKNGKKYELVEINGYPHYNLFLLVDGETEVYRFEDMASFSIFNAKEEIKEAFGSKVIRYKGKMVVEVNDDYFMTIEDEMDIKSAKVKHGYDIDFGKISLEPYDNMTRKDASILLALKQGKTIYKDGYEYKASEIYHYKDGYEYKASAIHHYPYNYVELTRLFDVDKYIDVSDCEMVTKVKFEELGEFTKDMEIELNIKEEIDVVIIDKKNPAFKDVLYLMLKAEEEGKITSNLKSVELYDPKFFGLKYVLTNTNDQDKLIAQYKYIESLFGSDIVIESVEDIKQLREMDLSKIRSCHQEYDTDRVIALLESKLDDGFLTILLTGVTIKVEE